MWPSTCGPPLIYFRLKIMLYATKLFSISDMAEPVYKFSPWKVSPLARLTRYPKGKTLDWLKRFMPKDPIYPGGGKFL